MNWITCSPRQFCLPWCYFTILFMNYDFLPFKLYCRFSRVERQSWTCRKWSKMSNDFSFNLFFFNQDVNKIIISTAVESKCWMNLYSIYFFFFFRDFIITLISIADKDARDIFIDSGFFCAGVLERRSRFWLEELCQDSQRQQCLLEVSGARFKASSEWEIIKYCSFGLPRLSQLFGE